MDGVRTAVGSYKMAGVMVPGGRSGLSRRTGPLRPYELRCAGWREDTQQGTLATGVALRGRWVSCRLASSRAKARTELGFPRPPRAGGDA